MTIRGKPLGTPNDGHPDPKPYVYDSGDGRTSIVRQYVAAARAQIAAELAAEREVPLYRDIPRRCVCQWTWRKPVWKLSKVRANCPVHTEDAP